MWRFLVLPLKTVLFQSDCGAQAVVLTPCEAEDVPSALLRQFFPQCGPFPKHMPSCTYGHPGRALCRPPACCTANSGHLGFLNSQHHLPNLEPLGAHWALPGPSLQATEPGIMGYPPLSLSQGTLPFAT